LYPRLKFILLPLKFYIGRLGLLLLLLSLCRLSQLRSLQLGSLAHIGQFLLGLTSGRCLGDGKALGTEGRSGTHYPLPGGKELLHGAGLVSHRLRSGYLTQVLF
jgi:hypothetical protein